MKIIFNFEKSGPAKTGLAGLVATALCHIDSYNLNRVNKEAPWGSGLSPGPLLIGHMRAHMIVTLGAIKDEVYRRYTRGCTLAASLPLI